MIYRSMDAGWIMGALGLGAGVAGVLYGLLRRRPGEDGAARLSQELASLRGDVQGSLQQNSAHLASTFTKTSADVRQELTQGLSDKFGGMNRELREELAKGRGEMRDGLLATTQNLEGKFTALEGKVNARLEAIAQSVQTKLDQNIKEGFQHFQKVQETLAGAEKQLGNLNAVGQSIQDLTSVLNLPHLRGKIIGEGNLERLLADFLPSAFYQMQYPIDGKTVDAVVKFPHLNLALPIDSKFQMEQVAALFEPNCAPDALKAARKRLSEVTRQNARGIRDKYIKPHLGTTDYALMYLPSETLYFEVIRDTELCAALAELKVFPISPNTMAITIFSIGKTLHYYEMAKGVQKTIQQLQLARGHMDHFRTRFDEIGEKLVKAQEAFATANTHLGRYASSVEKLSDGEPVVTPLPKPTPTLSDLPRSNVG